MPNLLVAKNQFNPGGNFASAGIEYLQRDLLNDLMQDTALISTDTVFSNFINKMHAPSPVYQYYVVDSLLENTIAQQANLQSQSDSISNLYIANCHFADSINQIYFRQLDSILLVGGNTQNLAGIESQLDPLHDQQVVYLAAINSINSNLQSIIQSQLSQISALNQSAMDTSNYEYYHKSINDIYFRSIAQGIYTFNATDAGNLYSIAHLCPLAGGTAVINGRAMYELIAHEVYNDILLCNPNGNQNRDQVLTNANSDSLQESSLIRLYPNPAKDKLILEWICGSPLRGDLVIADIVGRQLFKQTVGSNIGPQPIDVSSLNSGTYLARLITKNAVIYNSKIIIIR